MSTTITDNTKASICRSNNGAKLNSVFTDINDCTSDTELKRKKTFATDAIKIKNDIDFLKSGIQDTLHTGDAMFGSFGPADITKDVKQRNNELEKKKEDLKTDISKTEAIIEQNNRDFSDVKLSLPEQDTPKTLYFIEDYTLAFLSISYFFMVVICIYLYTIGSKEITAVAFGAATVATSNTGSTGLTRFFKALLVALFGTMFSGMILYYVC